MSTEQLTQEQAILLSGAAQVDTAITPQVTHDAAGNEIISQAEKMESSFSRNKDMLTMGIAMLAPMLPFMPDIYTPDKIEQIAVAFTAVEEKRGWNVQKYMSEEFVLALVAIPPTLQAIILTRQYVAAMRQEKTPINADADAERVADGNV